MKKQTRLRVYPRVYQQLAKQVEYYKSEVTGSAGARLGARFEKAVKRQIATLARSPERGAPYRFAVLAGPRLRWVSVKGFPKFLIFYQHDATANLTSVVNLRHSAMSPQSPYDQS
jgi:plasmid stabilization system protein ParE